MARCPVEYGTCHRETEEKCPTMGEDGKPVCSLGWTETPILTKNLLMVYDIVHRPDGFSELKLSQTHVQYLVLIAQRGGEIRWDYRKVTKEAGDHIRRLVEVGCIRELPLIGTEEVVHKLTDMGKRVVDMASRQQGIQV